MQIVSKFQNITPYLWEFILVIVKLSRACLCVLVLLCRVSARVVDVCGGNRYVPTMCSPVNVHFVSMCGWNVLRSKETNQCLHQCVKEVCVSMFRCRCNSVVPTRGTLSVFDVNDTHRHRRRSSLTFGCPSLPLSLHLCSVRVASDLSVCLCRLT